MCSNNVHLVMDEKRDLYPQCRRKNIGSRSIKCIDPSTSGYISSPYYTLNLASVQFKIVLTAPYRKFDQTLNKVTGDINFSITFGILKIMCFEFPLITCLNIGLNTNVYIFRFKISISWACRRHKVTSA